MHVDEAIEVRTPKPYEWIYVREASATPRIVSLMVEDDGPVHLVADNIVEHLRAQGIEPPCERNNMRYFHATLHFCCGRENPQHEDTSQFFFWAVPVGDVDSEARVMEATGRWVRYIEK